MTAFDFDPIWTPEHGPSPKGAASQQVAPGGSEHAAAELPYGLRRLRVDRQGNVVDQRWRRLRALLNPTAGIRKVVVDLRERELEFPFVYRFDDGAVSYTVMVRALVRVVDHRYVAREGVRSVRARIVPILGRMIDDCLALVDLDLDGDTVPLITENCRRIRNAVMRDVVPGADLPVGLWLRVTVVSVTVDLDEQSRAHLARLVEASRTSEVGLVDIGNRQVAASAQIQLRSTWSEYLQPRLSHPLTRAIERIATDPNNVAVTQVARELEARANQSRAQVLTLLNKLIDLNFVADVAELQEIKSLVERLHQTGDLTGEPEPVTVQATVNGSAAAGSAEPTASAS